MATGNYFCNHLIDFNKLTKLEKTPGSQQARTTVWLQWRKCVDFSWLIGVLLFELCINRNQFCISNTKYAYIISYLPNRVFLANAWLEFQNRAPLESSDLGLSNNALFFKIQQCVGEKNALQWGRRIRHISYLKYKADFYWCRAHLLRTICSTWSSWGCEKVELCWTSVKQRS